VKENNRSDSMRRLKGFVVQNWVLIASILAFLIIRSLWLETTISRDEGAFGFVGFMWMKGILPTYWLNTHAPLSYIIYILGVLLFGNSIIPIRLLNNLLFVGSYIIVYLTASKFFGKRIGLLSAFFFGFSMNLPILEAMTVLTEPVSILFSVISIYLCIKYDEDYYDWYLFASGFLMSVATLIRATNVVGFLLLVFVMMRSSSDRQHGFRRAILLLFSGALFPFLIFLAYFAFQNDLYGLMQLYLRAGSYLTIFQDLPFSIKYLVGLENLPVWVFSFIGVVVALKRRARVHQSLLFWAFLFVSVSLIPPVFGHRLVLLLPAVCILAGLGLDIVAARVHGFFRCKSNPLGKAKFNPGYLIVGSLTMMLIIPSLFYQSFQYPQMSFSFSGLKWDYADTDYNTQIEVSKYLSSHTASDGKVFVHGWAAEIYWLSERTPPTRYVWSLLSLPEDEENRLANLTKNSTFDYIVVFSPSYGDLFNRAESYDPLARTFFNYYILDKKINNAYIFSQYDNSSRVVYSFIDEFENSDMYFDSGNGKFGKTKDLENAVFIPRKGIYSVGDDIRYSIEQTPLNQIAEGDIVKSYLSYSVHIPSGAKLKFGTSFDPTYWYEAHETRFQIQVENSTGIYGIFDETINPKNESPQWNNYTLPLFDFANQDVRLVFVISTGPERLNSYSFALWGNPVLLSNV
jgi:Dolichyl-phosphate-mannose-protein mannosyltransferase